MDLSQYETADTGDDVNKHDLLVLQTLHEEIPLHTWYIFRTVHALLATLVLLVNCSILLVVYGMTSKITPTAQLATNLCFANMLAAWAIITMYFPHTTCQEEIQTGLVLTAFNAGMMTLSVHAVCYHIEVFRPMEYTTVVTRRRVWIAIAATWIVALLCAHVHFVVTLVIHHDNSLFCYQVFHNTSIVLTVSLLLATTLIIVVATVVAQTLLYFRPINTLRARNNPNSTVEPRKSTRDTTTLVMMTLVYVITWIPYIIVCFEHIKIHNNPRTGYVTAMFMFTLMTFVLVTCVANPIVCALRLDGIMYGFDRLYLKIRAWGIDSWRRVTQRLEQGSAGSGSGGDHMTTSSPLNPIESVC